MEDAALISLVKLGKTAKDLESVFKRTKAAIRHRIVINQREGHLAKKNINWQDLENIKKLISHRLQGMTNYEIANLFKTNKEVIKEAVTTLRKRGYNIPRQKTGRAKRA